MTGCAPSLPLKVCNVVTVQIPPVVDEGVSLNTVPPSLSPPADVVP